LTESLAIAVLSTRAEELRRVLRDRGLLRSDLVPVREGPEVYFPVRSPPEELGDRRSDWRLVPHDFPTRRPPRPRSYVDLLPWSESQRSPLPRSYDVVGDIVLIRLPESLREHRGEIGQALLRFVPGARLVVWDRGVKGPQRVRQLERLAGEGSLRTYHRENGLQFLVDLERAYFSPRLAGEHARVAGEAREAEEVLDLFCGIGPFSLTLLARHPRSQVLAVDQNRDAIELLRENSRRLGLEKRLTAVAQRAEELLDRGAATFDRVIMNLPHEGYKYLASVNRFVRPGGILHYYEIGPRGGAIHRGQTLLRDLEGGSPGARWALKETHCVHPYSPREDLQAFTFRCEVVGG